MILERPEEPGKKYALALTVLVHLLLAAFLFFGVQWKRSKPEVYEVELWSPTPRPATQVVAPPPPPPPSEVKPLPKPEPRPEPKVEPPPKKPDIAIKDEKKKPEPPKPEPKKPEPPKPEPKKPEPPKPEVKPQPKVDPFKEMLEREERQLKSSARSAATAQQMAHAAAAEAEQRASANKRGKADYANKIRGKIRGNIILPPSIQGNPEAVFKVEQLPTGEVLSVKLTRSSGNAVLDRAIETAILKSSPLPKPDDPSLFERTLEIKYRPFEE
ncbi:MAG: energy transducer TonB [Azonexus sp.]